MFGVPYPVFTRAPLVGSLDMDYWCSAFGTKGARVNTGYGTPNMFQTIFRISLEGENQNFTDFFVINSVAELNTQLEEKDLEFY